MPVTLPTKPPAPFDYGRAVELLNALAPPGRNSLVVPVGDVIDARGKFKGINPNTLTEGARPYAGGGGSAGGGWRTLPREARPSDVFPDKKPLTMRDMAADARLNTHMRAAFQRITKEIKDPAKRDAAIDRIYSASVSQSPEYSITLEMQQLFGR